MMKINNVDDLPIKIDFDALGKGFRTLLSEEDKGVLSFGMLPSKPYNLMVDGILENIIKIIQPEFSLECINKKLRESVEKKLTNAIYKHGELVV